MQLERELTTFNAQRLLGNHDHGGSPPSAPRSETNPLWGAEAEHQNPGSEALERGETISGWLDRKRAQMQREREAFERRQAELLEVKAANTALSIENESLRLEHRLHVESLAQSREELREAREQAEFASLEMASQQGGFEVDNRRAKERQHGVALRLMRRFRGHSVLEELTRGVAAWRANRDSDRVLDIAEERSWVSEDDSWESGDEEPPRELSLTASQLAASRLMLRIRARGLHEKALECVEVWLTSMLVSRKVQELEWEEEGEALVEEEHCQESDAKLRLAMLISSAVENYDDMHLLESKASYFSP